MDDDKFGCCSTCLNQGDWQCDECENASHYELDDELLDVDDRGRAFIRIREAA